MISDQLQVTRSVLTGVLDIRPDKIQASDIDSIQSPIHYTFDHGFPQSFLDYFHIDPKTGN